MLEKLKGCGIEDVDEIQVPNDPKNERKIKGFAFLRFNTCCDAKAAFHRLRKPDALFGNARCAKVAFAHTPVHPREEVRLQVGIQRCYTFCYFTLEACYVCEWFWAFIFSYLTAWTFWLLKDAID